MTEEYEPPLVEIGSPSDIAHPGHLAEGVEGYAVPVGDEIHICVIIGLGDGKIGAFLNSLSKRCVIVGVVSGHLRGMLLRRNWQCTFREDGLDEWRRGTSDHQDHRSDE